MKKTIIYILIPLILIVIALISLNTGPTPIIIYDNSEEITELPISKNTIIINVNDKESKVFETSGNYQFSIGEYLIYTCKDLSNEKYVCSKQTYIFK